MKKIIFSLMITVLLFFMYACANNPVKSESLVGNQRYSDCETPLSLAFYDDRDSRFKFNKLIRDNAFPSMINSMGDSSYDTPLNAVFEKMVVKRFGDHKGGYRTELRLKSYHTSYKFHDLLTVPVVGFLAIGANVNWTGSLKVDACILNSQNKYFLNKTYDETISEARTPSEDIGDGSLAVLQKLFEKFAAEFENDIRRTEF